MLVAGGVPATMPICLPFRRASAQRRDLVKAAALLDDQRVSGPVVGIGALHQVIALRIAHDDVATMRGKRHPDKTDRLRIVRIVQLFLQLFREQLAELVFDSLALVVRERQIARVGANPQHLGIDEFDRQVGAVIGLRAGDIPAGEYC